MADAIEAVEKPKAVEREKSGKSSDGMAGGRGKRKPSPKIGEGNKHAREAKRIAAKAVGMSRLTLERAKDVIFSVAHHAATSQAGTLPGA